MRTFSRHTRAEVIVATARIALVTVAATALFIDPSGPAHLRPATAAALTLYALYAAVAAIATRRLVPARIFRWRRLSHAIDFVAVAILNFLTYGPNSPLFIFFFFLLFCSTVRFDWRATVWTACATLLLYSAMGYYFGFVLRDAEFELNRFVVRIVYLATIGAALVYIDAYRERLQDDVRRIGEWPRRISTKIDDAAREILQHAAAQTRAARALMLWLDLEDGEAFMAEIRGERFSLADAASDGDDVIRMPALARLPWYMNEKGTAVVWSAAAESEPIVVQGDAVDETFFERHGGPPLLSVAFRGATVRGRLFFIGGPFSGEDLVVADIVAGLAASSLDQYHLSWRIGESAREEERLKVAADLHAGVLQTLAASGVKLHFAQRLFESKPAEARAALREVEESLQTAQRELRELFTDELSQRRSDDAAAGG